MKTLILMTGFIAQVSFASSDYSRGFCVPAAMDLVRDNAIVTIDKGSVDGRLLLLVREHLFFAPNNLIDLRAEDWGGEMGLQRMGQVERDVIYALYENHTHQHAIDQQIVRCIADDLN